MNKKRQCVRECKWKKKQYVHEYIPPWRTCSTEADTEDVWHQTDWQTLLRVHPVGKDHQLQT